MQVYLPISSLHVGECAMPKKRLMGFVFPYSRGKYLLNVVVVVFVGMKTIEDDHIVQGGGRVEARIIAQQQSGRPGEPRRRNVCK